MLRILALVVAVSCTAACKKMIEKRELASGSSVPEIEKMRVVRGDLEVRSLAIREDSRLRHQHDPTRKLWEGQPANTGLSGVRDAGAIIVMFEDQHEEAHCSAIAIDTDIIVTAAHCFTREYCGGEENPAYGHPLAFAQGKKPIAFEAVLHVIDGMVCASKDPCSADLALAHLSTAVSMMPADDFRIAVPDPDVLVLKVGYGAYLRNGLDPVQWVNPGTESQATVKLDPPPAAGSETYTYYGVNPDGAHVEVCGGDSGGPGLQIAGDDYRLVGITSSARGDSHAPKDANCNPTGKDIELSYYSSWIRDNIAAARAAPGNQCQ